MDGVATGGYIIDEQAMTLGRCPHCARTVKFQPARGKDGSEAGVLVNLHDPLVEDNPVFQQGPPTGGTFASFNARVAGTSSSGCVERALEDGSDCGGVLHTISACRGALNGLMVEVVAGQVRERVVEGRNRAQSSEAAEALLEALRLYLA